MDLASELASCYRDCMVAMPFPTEVVQFFDGHHTRAQSHLPLTGGIRPGLMPPVRHNMIPGMRAYQVVNRGIQACDEGILGHT